MSPSDVLATGPDLVVAYAPSPLRERAQWVCWKYVQRDDKPTKCPVNPHTGDMADSTDATTWGTFDQAIDAWGRDPELTGVGYVFAADDPFCGVDLDDCVDPATGELKSWAQRIVDELDSYAEYSPSGTGVKIFIEGAKPGTRCRKAYEDGEVEMYDRGRFFTLTGARLDSVPESPQARADALTALYRRVFGDVDDEPTPADVADAAPTEPAALSDDHILKLAASPKRPGGKGPKFADLWAGRWNAHFNSPSEADASLVGTLAYYTKDAAQIDRLFRASGLVRDKWDELRGERTYGEQTIESALRNMTGKQYRPRKRSGKPRTAADKGDGHAAINTDGEPGPGTIDPSTGRLILSTSRTRPTAQAYLRQFHQHDDGLTLRHYAGKLFAWRDNRYVELEDDALRHRLLPWMHEAVRMVYDKQAGAYVPVPFPANPTTVNAALDSIRAEAFLNASTVSPSWLHDDADHPDPVEILPCRSSLLHLPEMRHIAPTPAFFTVNALDYDPDPEAVMPEQWLKFLEQVFGDDLESVQLLQEWFGYCLTGDTSQQKMLLLVGPRRSGKGTIGRVLTRLVGSGNVCGPTIGGLAGNFGLQPLIGKSLAIVSDARFGGDHAATVVERLLCISGEDTLTIDRKHTTSVTMKLPTRFMFLTNELPRFTDASSALTGRFVVLRFTNSFYGQEDRTLTARLLDELPGILNWAIEGWRRLRERGHFVQPASVEDAVRDMEDLASPVGAFVRERCTVGVGQRVWVDDLYRAWRDWCETEGRTRVTTKQTFGRDLASAVPGVGSRVGTGNFRFYQGISLKEDHHDEPL